MRKYKDAILYFTLLIVCFIYALSTIKPPIVDIFMAEKGINEKTAELNEQQARLDKLLENQRAKMSQSVAKNIYKPEMSGLDPEASFSVMFDDIIDMIKYNGLKVYSIEYVYNPPNDLFQQGAADKFNVCQLNVALVGDYSALGSFIKELYKYPYLVNLDKIELTPYPKNRKILLANLQIVLYSSKQ